jgi:uncharacterized protein YggE
MKHMMTVLMLFPVVLGNVALSEEPPPIRTISVSGTVETKTAPDHVVWRITLTDTDKNLQEAKARNDEKVKAVVSLRDRLGLGKGDFETGRLSVRREYMRDQHGHRGDFRHFVVSRNATMRQRDLRRFDEFFDALALSAEMEVSFSFESSRIHNVRAETRLKALRAARDKAAAMAKVVGAKVGRAMAIHEHPYRDRWVSPVSNTGFVESTPTVDLATKKFVPGAITVRVTVYADFELK